MFPSAFQTLAEHFSRFPGVGPRQATRFALFLLRENKENFAALQSALQALKEQISLCENCFLPHEKNAEKLCGICLHPGRDKKIVCFVEKESDAMRMEKARVFNGLYYVLGGALTPLKQDDEVKRRIGEFCRRLGEQNGTDGVELILGLNPTREGNFTALYIEEACKKMPNYSRMRITRLARGLSTGAELEYLDEETLRSAIGGRM